jgi:hypothetical protein
MVDTVTLQNLVDRFTETLPEDERALMVLNGVGWHAAKALAVAPNVTLLPLPPCSPQIDPMERVWLYLRQRFLSLRILMGCDAMGDACCIAGNAIAGDASGIRTLGPCRRIRKVIG